MINFGFPSDTPALQGFFFLSTETVFIQISWIIKLKEIFRRRYMTKCYKLERKEAFFWEKVTYAPCASVWSNYFMLFRISFYKEMIKCINGHFSRYLLGDIKPISRSKYITGK